MDLRSSSCEWPSREKEVLGFCSSLGWIDHRRDHRLRHRRKALFNVPALVSRRFGQKLPPQTFSVNSSCSHSCRARARERLRMRRGPCAEAR
jgi:hypothetical protein